MRKKKKPTRNPMATVVRMPEFRKRVVKMKTRYTRKPRTPSGAFDVKRRFVIRNTRAEAA